MLWKYLYHLVREVRDLSTPGNHTLLCPQTNSVISPGGNSCHGDWKTPLRAQATTLVMDTEEV